MLGGFPGREAFALRRLLLFKFGGVLCLCRRPRSEWICPVWFTLPLWRPVTGYTHLMTTSIMDGCLQRPSLITRTLTAIMTTATASVSVYKCIVNPVSVSGHRHYVMQDPAFPGTCQVYQAVFQGLTSCFVSLRCLADDDHDTHFHPPGEIVMWHKQASDSDDYTSCVHATVKMEVRKCCCDPCYSRGKGFVCNLFPGHPGHWSMHMLTHACKGHASCEMCDIHVNTCNHTIRSWPVIMVFL